MQEKNEVTRTEYVAAVKAFKNGHPGKRLKDLLSTDNPEVNKVFWSNPIIRAYLQRTSVTFVDMHPQLFDSNVKTDHDKSDHYELKVYKYLPDMLFFRNNDILNTKFYTNLALAGESHDDIYDHLINTYSKPTADIKLAGDLDTYIAIRDAHTQRFQNPESVSPRFLIYSHRKDRHQTTILSILDPVTREVLASLFLNSDQSVSYYEYIKVRYFLWTALYDKKIHDEEVLKRAENYLEQTFSFSFDEIEKYKKPEILINKSEKAALILYYTPDENDSSEFDELAKQYRYLINSKQINSIFRYNIFGLSLLPKNYFIDVSHNLQIAKDDVNCRLYCLNFIKGITTMLKDPNIADRVLNLAKSLKTDPSCEQSLVKIFREQLKDYLPCYYDQTTGLEKLEAELRDFHLKQRWELGSMSLAIRYPQ